MEAFELTVEPRTGSGSAESRRIRKMGFVPSIVFSRGEESISAMVPEKEFVLMAQQTRSSQVLTLKSSKSELNGKSAIVKNVQKDFLKGTVLHIDLQALHENEAVSVAVVLKFVGEAPGVKVDGGILSANRHDIIVSCLPRAIPQEIQVDISNLRLGHSIHAKDLILPQGVELDGNPEETIVSVVIIRQVVEEVAPTATADAAAGATAGATTDAAAGATAAATAAPAQDKKGGDKK